MLCKKIVLNKKTFSDRQKVLVCSCFFSFSKINNILTLTLTDICVTVPDALPKELSIPRVIHV